MLGTLLFPAGSLDAIGWSLPALIGGIIVIAASGLRIWSMRTLDRLFTFEVSIRPKHRLVTTGPYDFVRHPSYIGAVFSYGGALLVFFARGGWTAGSGVLDTSIGRFVAVFWVVFFGTYLCAILVGRMPMEERVIKDMFGKEWERWADGVRWKLIPGVV